jgi:Fe-S-cluster containining protein
LLQCPLFAKSCPALTDNQRRIRAFFFVNWRRFFSMYTQFSCVGCGKCCTDHHVPLTLAEAAQWAADGGSVIVLTEAFLADGYGVPTEQLTHATRRSHPVNSGSAHVWVAITFAAYNAGRCRNLDADNLCRIYERRPLVCRIYPMEINPHIPLRPEAKDCPSESWTQGPDLIVGGQLVDQQLIALIEQSRQADRDDIARKQAICMALGINTTALKGNGFVAYLPEMNAFAEAVARFSDGELPPVADDGWSFRVAGDQATLRLQHAGARLETAESMSYMFIPLQSA